MKFIICSLKAIVADILWKVFGRSPVIFNTVEDMGKIYWVVIL